MEFLPIKCRKYIKDLEISEQAAKEIMKAFEENIDLGLGAKTRKYSPVKCIVTFLQDFPTGKETGTFLALDFGRKTYRILACTIKKRKVDVQSKSYTLPHEIVKGACNMLFDHIVSCLAHFLKENNIGDKELALGVHFGFPVTQVSLNKAILLGWKKGFNVNGVIGKDVVHLLQEAIKRHGRMKVKVVAIMNEVTGTLMSGMWMNSNCRIGVIIGKVNDICYLEKVQKAELFEGDKSKPFIVIRAESAGFGDDGKLNFIQTEIDKELDNESLNKGECIGEKMMAGRYMGELVTLTLCKLAKNGAIFGGQITEKLRDKKRMTIQNIAAITSDLPGCFSNSRKILAKEFEYPNVTTNDCAIVYLVCMKILERSAHMCAATLASVVNRIEEEKTIIAVDGLVYRHFPRYHDLLMKYLSPLVFSGYEFDLIMSEDGQGKGTALVAAVTVSSQESVDSNRKKDD